MKKQSIHNPHDKFFRASMQHPKLVEEFLQAHMPPDILKRLDLSQLTICQTTFIDEELRLSQADVLLETQINNHLGYVHILVEHQSQPDKVMAFRLLKYSIRIWEYHQDYQPSEKLPVIFPMVFYTGKKAWGMPRSIWEMCEDAELMRAIWQAPFTLIDVNQIKEEESKTRLRSGAMELVMRYQFREGLKKELGKVAWYFEQLDVEKEELFLLQLLNYIMSIDEEHHSIAELAEQLRKDAPSFVEKNMASLAERIFEQGQQQGMQDGILQGRQQGIQEGFREGKLETARAMFARGADLVFIKEVTGLSIAKLKLVQREVKLEEV